MTNRNYKVSGKKLLSKPYNLRRNQAKKLGRAIRRMNQDLPKSLESITYP
jgi:hypothetical protein